MRHRAPVDSQETSQQGRSSCTVKHTHTHTYMVCTVHAIATGEEAKNFATITAKQLCISNSNNTYYKTAFLRWTYVKNCRWKKIENKISPVQKEVPLWFIILQFTPLSVRFLSVFLPLCTVPAHVLVWQLRKRPERYVKLSKRMII